MWQHWVAVARGVCCGNRSHLRVEGPRGVGVRVGEPAFCSWLPLCIFGSVGASVSSSLKMVLKLQLRGGGGCLCHMVCGGQRTTFQSRLVFSE